MTYALKIVTLEGRLVDQAGSDNPDTARGEFVRDFDADAHGGQGALLTTRNPAQALRFATFEAAHEFWRQQSRVRPLRPDGQPNRPLTAFSIAIEPLSQPSATSRAS